MLKIVNQGKEIGKDLNPQSYGIYDPCSSHCSIIIRQYNESV